MTFQHYNITTTTQNQSLIVGGRMASEERYYDLDCVNAMEPHFPVYLSVILLCTAVI